MQIDKLKKNKLFINKEITSFKLLKTQGFCNDNYLLKCKNKKYLVRVFKNHLSNDINRLFEFNIQKKAYKKNIAKKPLYLDDNKTYMICKYAKGIHKYKLNNNDIKNISTKVNKLHKIKFDIKNHDFNEDYKYYMKKLKDKKSKKILRNFKLNILKLNKYDKNIVLSHHDLNAKNIIFNKNSIYFIDWEFARKNDCFFDLAALCIEFNLCKKQENILLKSYFNKIKEQHYTKLIIYKNIYTLLCSLWLQNNNLT